MKPFAVLHYFLLIASFATCVVAAELRHDFESAETSWKLVDTDGSSRILEQRRDFETAHTGRGSEYLRLWAAQSTYIHLAHPVTPAVVIEELLPSLWVKADRPGLRLMVRVVLPRSTDERGKPLAVLLEGDSYTRVSFWQQLFIRDLRKRLIAEVQRRRLQFDRVDERQAYVDHVVVNAYGGEGVTSLWIDDLLMEGHASTSPGTTAPAMMLVGAPVSAPTENLRQADVRCELQGAVLLVDGRPFFPRVIDHRGEPLARLKSLGFNAVLLEHPPTAAQLAEARQASMWLIAPPPLQGGAPVVTPAHERVLVWHLRGATATEEGSTTAALAAVLRRQENGRARPILREAAWETGLSTADADLLLITRPVVGTGFDLQRLGAWLVETSRREGTRPFWGSVETEPCEDLQQQLRLARLPIPPLPVEYEQMRQAAFENAACGARGLWFRSHSRLDQEDEATRLRAASLRLINAELALVEPWLCGGSPAAIAAHQPQLSVRALETDRSRILIVNRPASEVQFVPAAAPGTPVAFTIHGTPLTDQAFHLKFNGLQPLWGAPTSGTRIAYDDAESLSLVLLTQDPLVINRVARDLSSMRELRARQRHTIAALRLRQTERVLREIGEEQYADKIVETRDILTAAEQLLVAGDFHAAFRESVRADQGLAAIRRETWQRETYAFPSPVSSPLCYSFAALPLHRQAARLLGSGEWSENLLPAGDCEALESMLREGWKQHRHPAAGVDAVIELSPHHPAGGRSALRLVAHGTPNASISPEGWPIWLTARPLEVRQGQLIRVTGWVKISEPIRGNDDGLLIFDSLAGPAFADRVTQTEGWRRLALYRIAPRDATLTLTFALTGIGEAWLDEISVSVMD